MKRPSWLRWPCVSAEWADTLQARVERREAERNEADRRYTDLNEKYTAVCIVNTCLTEDLTKAREELAEARAQAADSLAGQLRAQLKRETRRANRLQKQYDDAVGLKPGGIEDSRPWQLGYKADAS